MLSQEYKTYPGTAAVLSFIFNGLGQLYNGQIFKGLVIIFLSSLSMLIFILGSIIIVLWFFGKIILWPLFILGFVLFLFGIIAICIIGIYSIFDAYRFAKRAS
ncbi:MAG: hypothetical protein NC912_02615 [Candidatus Omnitrophica bacterium]|nr:hypothetical protein [Candidatus Omnitrophota bacterium]